MLNIITFSAIETADAGFKLGSILNRGDVVCLIGGLGTGKTAFTGGIAEALGIEGYITSPTFTIVNEYQGRIPLYHFDAYRIANADEMFEIGFDEYLEANGIVVIEWADLIREILPHDYVGIHIEKDIAVDPDKRIISMEFHGKRYLDYERRYDK
jgi:tRNA threonylcarbamoyladenosine biosynthesis protein TsaE